MGLYEILKASKLGAGAAPDKYTALFAQKIGGSGGEAELSGVPPLTFPADGTPLIDLLISGNEEHTGTPTPDSPIIPQGTGEKTGNLWSEEYPNISGTIRYIPLYVGEGSFTLSTTTPYDSGVANLFLLSGNVSTGASTLGNGAWEKHNVTVQSDSGYITIAYRQYTGATSPAECETMLNTGSIALPYEPYGYRISILSADTTTPVYLGEVETTRRVKKLVLTGEEDWFLSTAQAGRFGFSLSNYLKSNGTITSYCSHYTAIAQKSGGTAPNNSQYFYSGSDSTRYLFIVDTSCSTAADFKSYLSAQYAADTPVCVWYVLSSATTGIVNEPLMKIGDYADTLSKAQTGVSIPTANGSTTVDVDTTLKPSEVYIKYRT